MWVVQAGLCVCVIVRARVNVYGCVFVGVGAGECGFACRCGVDVRASVDMGVSVECAQIGVPLKCAYRVQFLYLGCKECEGGKVVDIERLVLYCAVMSSSALLCT